MVSFRRVTAGIVVAAVLAAACGGDDDAAVDAVEGSDDQGADDLGSDDAGAVSDAGAATESGGVLRMAFSADMEPPDPDGNYQLEGNQVMTALYEGLVDYAADGSADIVPLLATDWTISDDGLTYSFELRDDVVFHDGTPLDSEALRAGFERRADESIGAPMGYMLLPVESIDTPDPTTFIINLAYPESAFLTYLASPFSPKAISPTALAEHEVDGDGTMEWLRTNSAGTGPYKIAEFELGQRYVLERHDEYWGPQPDFERVEISIIPDAATQVLRLEGGDLDIVSAQPINTVRSFAERDGFQVVTFPVLQKGWIHVNMFRPPFDNLSVREAVRAAIDRPRLVDQIWGEYATESTQMFPVQNLPEGFAADAWEHDPAPLEAISGDLGPIELAYPATRPLDQETVEAVQAQLGAAGLDVVLAPTQDGDVFAWMDDVENAPHLYYEVSYPDSTHPDTWSRLFWYSDLESGFGGFLNYFRAGSPESDALMDAGLGAVDPDEVDAAFGESGDLLFEQVGYITIADPLDVFISREGIGGFANWLPTPVSLQLKLLTDG